MSGESVRPTFLGIGAQRCGTTWLYRVLQAHPQVVVSETKELDFFSFHYKRGLDWYRDQFANPAGASAWGEVSPSYMEHPLAAVRARSYNPEFRILCSLRHPVERAWSNHLFNIREGYLKGNDLSFESALGRHPLYLERSLYASALRPWLEAFARDRVLVLFQEDIARDPREAAHRVLRFLGLPPLDHAVLAARPNRGRLLRHPSLHRLQRGGARLLERLGLGTAADRLRATAAWRRWRDWNRLEAQARVPPMEAQTRARLVEALTPEVRALMQLLGVKRLPWADWSALYDDGAP